MWEAWVLDETAPNTLNPGRLGELRQLCNSGTREGLEVLLSEYAPFYDEFVVVSPSGAVETLFTKKLEKEDV